MQADQLVLSVDAANDGNPANQTYKRYQEFENRSVYISSAHLPESRDMIGLYRTFPTKSGNFKGVSKSAIKLTEDVEVAGVDSSTTLTSPIIFEMSFSVPVGATAAQIVGVIQRGLPMLDNDTLITSIVQQLEV